jgi:Tfp pilus assembly protein PilN
MSSENQANQSLIYAASFVGVLGLLGVFAEAIRRKHVKEVQKRAVLLEALQQRQQQVIGKKKLMPSWHCFAHGLSRISRSA